MTSLTQVMLSLCTYLYLQQQGSEVEDGGVVVQHLPLHLHKGLAQGLLGHPLPFLHRGLWSCCHTCKHTTSILVY